MENEQLKNANERFFDEVNHNKRLTEEFENLKISFKVSQNLVIEKKGEIENLNEKIKLKDEFIQKYNFLHFLNSYFKTIIKFK